MQRLKSSLLAALMLGIAGGAALAVERDVKATAVPTKISGTLSPFTLAVDGNLVLKSPGKGFTLSLNGMAVKAGPGAGSPFALHTSDERLEFLVMHPGDRAGRRVSVELPRLVRSRLTATTLECMVEGPAQEMSLDGKRIELVAGTASIPLPREDSWWDRPHALRIAGIGGRPGRAYAVHFVTRVAALPELGGGTRRRVASLRPSNRMSLASFQLGSTGAYQDSSASSFAPEVSWNPTLIVSRLLALRGNIGVMAFKASEDKASFVVTEYEMLFSWLIQPLIVEAGGGLQTWWHASGGTSPVAAINAGFFMGEPWLGAVDRFFVGYEAAFNTNYLTHELKLGLGLRF